MVKLSRCALVDMRQIALAMTAVCMIDIYMYMCNVSVIERSSLFFSCSLRFYAFYSSNTYLLGRAYYFEHSSTLSHCTYIYTIRIQWYIYNTQLNSFLLFLLTCSLSFLLASHFPSPPRSSFSPPPPLQLLRSQYYSRKYESFVRRTLKSMSLKMNGSHMEIRGEWHMTEFSANACDIMVSIQSGHFFCFFRLLPHFLWNVEKWDTYNHIELNEKME